MFELFHESRERTGEARVAYLQQECGADQSLIAAVEQLLQEDEGADGFLSQPFSGLRRPMGPAISEGQDFGRYTTTSYLGRGGMGEVWRGHDRDLDRPVALKFLTRGFGTDQLTREARLASALNHPGIVTVHEVLAHQQTPVLVMELVEGSSLANISSGPKELRNLLPLFVQISDALAAAHARGIIHGDLKPDNILVRPDGIVKILDFGLARNVTTDTIADGGLMAGTLIYMSPEQARGERLTPATDVFSLGLLMFKLITGQHAFGDSALGSVQRMLHQPAPHPSTIAPSLGHAWDSLLQDMLQPDIERRPAMSAIAARLRGIGQPASQKGRWIVAAAIVLVAIAGALVLLLRSKPAAEPQWIAYPLTSDPGDEFGASFSPDGTQVVYAWRPEEERYLGIYVQSLSGEGPRRLVDNSSMSYAPAWSPDGRSIAFIHAEGQTAAIMVIPASGGPARRILPVHHLPYHARRALDWSPDSEWIAYSDRDPANQRVGLFGVSLRTGQSRRLVESDGIENIEEPIFSSDGSLLAFVHGADGVSRLGVLRLSRDMVPQGRPWTTRLSGFETAVAQSPMWRRNGKELLFLSNKGGAGGHLWSVEVSGAEKNANAPRMLGSLGDGVMSPAISRAGDQLIFTRRLQDKNIWRVALTSRKLEQTRLVSSTQQEYFPQYSPDGRQIAFESDRSGFPEIWISDSDGRKAFALTNFRGPVTGSPAWSPDGTQIAFDTRAAGLPNVYVIAAQPGATPRRITSGASDNFLPVWSPDGKFVYFNSNRKGDLHVWRAPSSGGPEEQVTTRFSFAPQLSQDGEFLYYQVSQATNSTVHRLNLKSGREETVVKNNRDRSYFVTSGGVYYVQGVKTNVEAIRFWNAASKVDSLIVETDGRHAGGLSISRDNRFALIVRDDSAGADLVLVRDFH